jgi:hypothetical protein
LKHFHCRDQDRSRENNCCGARLATTFTQLGMMIRLTTENSENNKPYKFQDVLKYLDTSKKAKEDETEKEKHKELYENFIKDCHGIVERCNICLKRRIKITGYKYEI